MFVLGNYYVGAMEVNSAEQHSDRIRLLVTYAGPANPCTKGGTDSAAQAGEAQEVLDLFAAGTP